MTGRAMAAAVLVCVMGAAAGAQCEQGWDDRFVPPDVDAAITGVVWHDDGAGQQLYLVGPFTRVKEVPAPGVARWDGQAWGEVPGGLSGPSSLVSGGPGQPLYALGGTKRLHGEKHPGPLAWDGASWEPFATTEPVSKLVPGPTAAPDRVTYKIGNYPGPADLVHWDGSRWVTIASGDEVQNVIRMVWFDGGSSATLVVTGLSLGFAGQGVMYAAQWDRTRWSAMGSGPGGYISGQPVVFDDGTGPGLYCCVRVQSGYWVKRWSGSGWASVFKIPGDPNTMSLTVADAGDGPQLLLTTSDDESGRQLYAWDGAQLSLVFPLFDGAFRVAPGDPTLAPGLLVYGGFRHIEDGRPMVDLARWDGATWHDFGFTGFGLGLRAGGPMAAAHATGNPALDGRVFVTEMSGDYANFGAIQEWDGTRWRQLLDLEVNFENEAYPVFRMALADLGRGPRLIIAGYFDATTEQVAMLAQWDGDAWSSVGDPAWFTNLVRSIVPQTREGKRGMYVLGEAREVGQDQYTNVAWVTEDELVPIPAQTEDSQWPHFIRELCGYESESGWQLIAAGGFHEIEGVPADMIAAWDGQSWAPLGDGLQSDEFEPLIWRVIPYTTETEHLLFAMGKIERSGSTPIPSGLAVWDGTAWRDAAPDLPLTPVRSVPISSISGPDGPTLLLRGVGDDGGYRAAILDDNGWRVLPGEFDRWIDDGAVINDATGRSVYLSGDFSVVDDVSTTGFARFGCPPCPADFDADGDADEADVVAYLDLWTLGDVAADVNRDGYIDTRDVLAFFNAWGAGC